MSLRTSVEHRTTVYAMSNYCYKIVYSIISIAEKPFYSSVIRYSKTCRLQSYNLDWNKGYNRVSDWNKHTKFKINKLNHNKIYRKFTTPSIKENQQVNNKLNRVCTTPTKANKTGKNKSDLMNKLRRDTCNRELIIWRSIRTVVCGKTYCLIWTKL